MFDIYIYIFIFKLCRYYHIVADKENDPNKEINLFHY